MAGKRCLVACSMLETEIRHVMAELNSDIEIVWMDRGLHTEPEKLLLALQDEVDRLQDMDEILLCYGLCGNGTNGLRSRTATLVIPKFDDCINMLLCTGKRTARALVQKGVIYQSGGWAQFGGILHQYQELKDNYGYDEETIADLMEMMYENYTHLAFLDTGCADRSETLKHLNQAAKLLNLDMIEVQGSVRILEQLIKGEYNENFIILPPGHVLRYSDFEFCLPEKLVG